MTPKQLENRTANLELINAEITASLARQAGVGQRLDTKAVLLVGYAGAASAFLATRPAQHVLAVLAYVAYGACAISGILAYAVRFYRDVPEPRRLFTGYMSSSRAHTLAALASTRVEAFEQNVPKHRQKARLWWISVGSLSIGMTLMIFALSTTYWKL